MINARQRSNRWRTYSLSFCSISNYDAKLTNHSCCLLTMQGRAAGSRHHCCRQQTPLLPAADTTAAGSRHHCCRQQTPLLPAADTTAAAADTTAASSRHHCCQQQTPLLPAADTTAASSRHHCCQQQTPLLPAVVSAALLVTWPLMPMSFPQQLESRRRPQTTMRSQLTDAMILKVFPLTSISPQSPVWQRKCLG